MKCTYSFSSRRASNKKKKHLIIFILLKVKISLKISFFKKIYIFELKNVI